MIDFLCRKVLSSGLLFRKFVGDSFQIHACFRNCWYFQLDSIESWNLRDTYMSETIEAILVELEVHCGVVNPKLVVWAHNSHLGIVRMMTIY